MTITYFTHIIYADDTDSANYSVDRSGACGENCTYEIGWGSNGRFLKIEGTGKIDVLDDNGFFDFWKNDWKLFEGYDEVIIGEGITEIGRQAFDNLVGVWNSSEGGYNYAILSLPSTLKKIGQSAFYGSHVKNLVIPDSVEFIDHGAFSYGKYESIQLPNNDCVLNDCFFGSVGFKIIEIPANKISLQSTFFNCPDLEEFICDPDATVTITSGTFYEDNKLRKVVFPNNIESIYLLFSESEAPLEEVNFPSSLKNMNYAFNKSKIKKGIVPDLVDDADSAFRECQELTELDIGIGLKKAFDIARDCPNLETVYIRSEDIKLYDCFKNDESLKDIYFAGTKEWWDENCWDDYINERIANGETTLHCEYDFDQEDQESYAYAILDDEGNLTFFRSEGTYNDLDEGRFEDIHGNNYEGTIFTGFESEQYTSVKTAPWYSYKDKIKKVSVAENQTISPISTAFWFYNCRNIVSFNAKGFDTSEVTSMEAMFSECRELTTLDLSTFDTSKVQKMSGMFNYCIMLQDLNISTFDTSSLTDLGYMFSNCRAIKKIDLSHFDTSKVNKIDGLFDKCYLIEEIDISNFDTSNVKDFGCMFLQCYNLKNIDVSSFDTSKATTAVFMFGGCHQIKTLDLSNFVISSTTDTSFMFDECTNLETIIIPKTFNNIKDTSFMDSNSLKDIYYEGSLSEWNTICKDDGLQKRIEDDKTILHCNYKDQYHISIDYNDGSEMETISYTTTDLPITISLGDHEKKERDFYGWSGTGIDGVDRNKKLLITEDNYGDKEFKANWLYTVHFADDANQFNYNLMDLINNLDSSSTYSPEMAYVLSLFSEAVYKEQNIKKSMTSYLFEPETGNYGNYSDGNHCAYAIGTHNSNIGKVLFLSVRGSDGTPLDNPTPPDWKSNFYLQKTLSTVLDPETVFYHSGFYKAAKEIFDQLNKEYDDYIDGSAKIIITGHSRGAAVGNIIAKWLSCSLGKEKVYAYTFACPDNNFGQSYERIDSFSNIINISNMKDPVPNVPGVLTIFSSPIADKWHKYGKHYVFYDGSDLSLFQPHFIDPERHNLKYYRQWLDDLPAKSKYIGTTGKYSESFFLKDIWGNGRVIMMKCPIRAEVYLNGELILDTSEHEYWVSEKERILLEAIGEDKYLYVANDLDIEVKIYAEDDGDMEFDIVDLDEDANKTYLNYENIELKNGKQFNSNINDAEDITGIQLYVQDTIADSLGASHFGNKAIVQNNGSYEDNKFADEIPCFERGDTNGDGVVNGEDNEILLKYLSNWDEYEDKVDEWFACDVNNDGVIDLLDCQILNNYIEEDTDSTVEEYIENLQKETIEGHIELVDNEVKIDKSSDENIVVPLELSQNSGFTKGQYKVTWNDNALTLKGIEAVNASLSASAPINSETKSPYILTIDNSGNESTTGILCNLIFSVNKDQTDGEYEIKIEPIEGGWVNSENQSIVELSSTNIKIIIGEFRTVIFKYNNGDKDKIEKIAYGKPATKPKDPIKEGKSFAGWFVGTDKTPWDFTKSITSEVVLNAQWIEQSITGIINGKEVSISTSDLSGKTADNTYNNKPLVIVGNNGVIVVPAGSVEEIPSIFTDLARTDLKNWLNYSSSDGLFGLYLKIDHTKIIDGDISQNNKSKGYTEVTDSGFDAKLMRIRGNEESEYKNNSPVTITLDLKKMGISLEETPKGYARTYYVAHKKDDSSVEYLPLTLSGNMGEASFRTSSLSPFALVYEEKERTKPVIPPQESKNDTMVHYYSIPKTGVK